VKKSCPKVVKKIKIPLYGGEMWLFLDRISYVDAKVDFGYENELDDCCGETTSVNTDDGGRVYLVGVFSGGLMQTLVHELGHVTFFVCSTAGIDPSASNGEPYCYLLDYLFGEAAPEVAQAVMKAEGVIIKKARRSAP
jgi:hypothetical protein